jgi:hypothetical protein
MNRWMSVWVDGCMGEEWMGDGWMGGCLFVRLFVHLFVCYLLTQLNKNKIHTKSSNKPFCLCVCLFVFWID